MTQQQQSLLAEFPEVSEGAWRAQVDKDLKGGAFEKRLVTRTLEEIDIQPLYVASEALRAASIPGAAAAERWDIRAIAETPSAAALPEELAKGATSVWVRCGALREALDAVDLATTPVQLDSGGDFAMPSALFALARERGVDAGALRGSLGLDPIGALARDGVSATDETATRAQLGDLARQTRANAPHLRSVDVSVIAYHEAGATSVQELGYALATATTYLRWLEAEGLGIDDAARQIGFTVAIGSDLFMEIAKLRALRLCFAKVVAACGGSAAAQVTTIHAVTAQRNKTVRDPWVNMLRATTEAFSAMTGGADSLTTRGYDAAIGASDELARRVARNLHVVLDEEAHLTRVSDPAAGSYYVESLTQALCEGGWKLLQAIEAEGGMLPALVSGLCERQIAEVQARRAAAVRTRRAPVLGVSEFANLAEQPVVRAPLPAHPPRADGGPLRCRPLLAMRDAEPFEALRARAEAHERHTGSAVRAFLCNLGTIPQHKARSTFSAGFLNAGGISTVDNDGFATPEAAAQAFAASGARLAVLCGTDEQYTEWVASVAPLLRGAGATEIVLAGRPGDHEAAYRRAGVTAFIFMGADATATLASLLARAGVAP